MLSLLPFLCGIVFIQKNTFPKEILLHCTALLFLAYKLRKWLDVLWIPTLSLCLNVGSRSFFFFFFFCSSTSVVILKQRTRQNAISEIYARKIATQQKRQFKCRLSWISILSSQFSVLILLLPCSRQNQAHLRHCINLLNLRRLLSCYFIPFWHCARSSRMKFTVNFVYI